MTMSLHWRELQQDRLAEAVRVLSALPGVHGLIIGGSIGRGESWPMSDIDLLPVYDTDDADVRERVDRERSELVDWWSASGRPQALDLGRLAFTVQEVTAAIASGPDWVVERLTGDSRWFHGLDKAFMGRAADPHDRLTSDFTEWLGRMRFDPSVVAARIAWWRETAARSCERAGLARDAGNADEATYFLRDAARALRHVVLEGWGERLGSMGREWTRFEQMADARGQRELADRISILAGAHAAEVARREPMAPLWLRERIELCWFARVAVQEDVSRAANARDQIAAFCVHVARYRPDLAGPWTGSPDPALDERLDQLEVLLRELS